MDKVRQLPDLFRNLFLNNEVQLPIIENTAMSVGKCKLCLVNDATKSGSHVLSHFLIKGSVNQPGKTARGYEMSFKFASSPTKGPAFYAGSKVLPERIEELFQRELTEEDKVELATYKDEVVYDYVFCPDCEKRFGPVERYFEEHISSPLRNAKAKLVPDNRENHIFENPKLDKGIIRLFVIMQLWRSSAVKFDDFTIKPKFEEKLRKILNAALAIDLPTTMANAKRDEMIIAQYPMLLTFMQTKTETSEKVELTKNGIQLGKSKMPYFGLVNDFAMQLYEKESHIYSAANHFYGLTNMLDKKRHINQYEKVFKIGVLNDDKRKEVSLEALYTVANLLRSNTKKIISEFYIRAFNHKPNEYLLEGIFMEINATPDPNIRYSLENVLEITGKIFIQMIKTQRFPDFSRFHQPLTP